MGERHERVVLMPRDAPLLMPGSRVELRPVGCAPGGWFRVRSVGLASCDPPDPFNVAWGRAGLRPVWVTVEAE